MGSNGVGGGRGGVSWVSVKRLLVRYGPWDAVNCVSNGVWGVHQVQQLALHCCVLLMAWLGFAELC